MWLSAVWSRSTLAAFRSSVTALLAAASSAAPGPTPGSGSASSSSSSTFGAAASHPDVFPILRHWSLAEIPLSESRRLWRLSRAEPPSVIANLIRRKDRMALCAYELTGAVGEAGDTGSVAMFALPDAAGAHEHGQSFLGTLGLGDLGAAAGVGSADVATAGAALAKRRLRALEGHLRSGALAVELRPVEVEPGSAEAIREVEALAPRTINWGNLCDYVQPEAFFAMARACSSRENVSALCWGARGGMPMPMPAP